MAKHPRYWAVIPSAGGGSRMNLGQPKQYLQLSGKTMLEWSVAPFLQAEWIDGVVMLLPRSDTRFAQLAIARHPKIVLRTGGVTRLSSVLAGLDAVEGLTAGLAGSVQVLLHDVSRPCVTVDDIERLCDEADDAHGGLLAVPLSDALVRERRDRAAESLDGRALWRAQSPQLFPLERLRQALLAADSASTPDEAAAMQAAGFRPRLVRGRQSNVKVTYADDLPVAEFWLSRAEYLR